MKQVLTAHEMVDIKRELHDQVCLPTDQTIPAMLRRAAEMGYRRALVDASRACRKAARTNQTPEDVAEVLKKLVA
jgi:hypothetical protein